MLHMVSKSDAQCADVSVTINFSNFHVISNKLKCFFGILLFNSSPVNA
jgi:hypothetical protein